MIRFRSRSKGVIHKRSDFSGFGGTGAGSGGSMSGTGMGPGAGSSGFGTTTATQQTYTPVIDFLDEGSVVDLWLSRAPERMHRVWRRIYAEDAVCGQAVEIYKDLPWSEFQLVGVEDSTILNFYIDALNAINAISLCPMLTQEFLVQGKAIGQLTFDDQKGYFTNAYLSDPDHVRVTPCPVAGFAPKLDLLVSPAMKMLMDSKDPRDKAAQQALGPMAAQMRVNKDIPLHPAASFYLPRQLAPYDSIGASVYTRVLALCAYEKALTNSTLLIANRRISRIRQVVVGEDNWEPTQEEIETYASMFMDAEKDPMGALVGTRTGVAVNEVGGNTLSDVVKLGDEWDFLTKAKMNALGISEALMSGDASYNSMEQVLQITLDRLRAHRSMIVNRILIDQILKPLAKKHGFIRQTKASLDHRIRVANGDDRSDYILPGFVFEKKLRPTENKDALEVLNTLKENGIPISYRTWAAAAGLDLNMEVDQYAEDLEFKQKFSSHNAAMDKINGGGEDAGGDEGGGEEDLGDEGVDALAELTAAGNAKADALHAAMSLPHMASASFLGVTRSGLQERVEKLSTYLGGRSAKRLTSVDVNNVLRTGNTNRDNTVMYLLSRAGLLQHVQLPREFCADAVRELCSMGLPTEELAGEVEFLYGLAAGTAKPKAVVGNRRPKDDTSRKLKIVDKSPKILTGADTGFRGGNYIA